MAYLDTVDKWKLISSLIQKVHDTALIDTPNILDLFDDAQAEGVNPNFLFPNFIKLFNNTRRSFSNMFIDTLKYQNNIMSMWADDIGSSDLSALKNIFDLLEYMDDNAHTVKSRDFVRGDLTYKSNAGVIVTHNVDYLGYVIETGKIPTTWTLRCTLDQHIHTDLFWGGGIELIPTDLKLIGDELDPEYKSISEFSALNASSSAGRVGLKLRDTFASFNIMNGFGAGWEVDSGDWSTNTNWTNEVFVHHKKGTKTQSKPLGTGDSGFFSGNEKIYRHLDNFSFQRYAPYMLVLAYKHQDAAADGRLTLGLGSESVQSPADGLTGALTGTTTFAASTALVGSGTKYLSELKPGDLVWNSTNDAIGDAKVVASVETDLGATLGAAYAATTGAGKALSAKHTGWHYLTLVKYLDDFQVPDITLSIEKSGHGAGNIYFDELIFKQMTLRADLARYVEFIADSVDLKVGDEWEFVDTLVADSVLQRWFVRQYGVSLPHSVTPSIIDPV